VLDEANPGLGTDGEHPVLGWVGKLRTPLSAGGGAGVDAVGVVEGVPDLRVQAVCLLEEVGRLRRVAVGGRGPGERVEGQGLGLEVLMAACHVEHGVEVPDGGPGAGFGGQGGEEAAGDQGAVSASGRPLPAEILDLYRRHQGAVTAWFLVLAISGALLVPAGILLGRLAGGSRGHWILIAMAVILWRAPSMAAQPGADGLGPVGGRDQLPA
jgi:hypothetical protein